MVSEGCVRCHSNNTPRRKAKGNGAALICQNTHACRRRQARLYRQRARTLANS